MWPQHVLPPAAGPHDARVSMAHSIHPPMPPGLAATSGRAPLLSHPLMLPCPYCTSICGHFRCIKAWHAGEVWMPMSLANSESEVSKSGGPYSWQAPFPSPHIQAQLVSSDNPQGCITNSDLDLAGIIAHANVLACHHPFNYEEIWVGCDNTSTVDWTNRGSATTEKAPAFLLWLQGLLAHQHHYNCHMIPVPGTTNLIANFCSCSFHLTDSAFLTALDSQFPLLQGS